MRPFKIGLTGGIGSGKSTVGDILKGYGIPVLDADDVVHELYQQDEILQQEILQLLGPSVLGADGKLDRQRVGALVFSNPEQRKALEALIHPKVRQQVQAFLSQEVAGPKVVIIPLLFENGLEQWFDETWLVAVTPEQQLKRLMDNRGMQEDEARVRILSQMPLDEKIKRADRILRNEGSLTALHAKIQQLLAKIPKS